MLLSFAEEFVRSNRHLSNIALYSIPGFFSKAVSILLIPLYTAYLSVSEFGQLELLLLIGTFLHYAFHFGWSSAHIRFYKEKEFREDDLNRTLLIFRITVQGSVWVWIFLLGADRLAALVSDDADLSASLWLVALLYLIREYLLFYETRYRVLERVRSYVAINITHALLQLGAIYYLFAIQNLGILGIVLGHVAASALSLSIFMVQDWNWLFRGKFDAAIMKRCWGFGLPLVSASIAMFLMSASDRYMLKWLYQQGGSSLGEVGIYSLAIKLIVLMTLVTRGFQLFWAPYAYASYGRPDAERKFAYIFRNYASILFLASLLLLSLLPFIYQFFPDYSSGRFLIPVMVSGFLLYNIGDYFCVGIDIKEKTNFRTRAGILAAILNITLNALLIPHWGGFGAALATTCSFAVFVAYLMRASHRLFPVSYAWSVWLFGAGWLLLGLPVLVFWEGEFWYYFAFGTLSFLYLYFRAGGYRRDWEC